MFLCFVIEAQAFQKKSKFDHLVTISTQFGDMNVLLFDDTPAHKENFLKLAQEGAYDSLLFHRVIDEFMIQTGDFDSRNAKKGDHLGRGGPDYKIPAEILPKHFHRKGALAAARQSDAVNPERASSGSQFYIVQGKVEVREVLEKPKMPVVSKALKKLKEEMRDHELVALFNEAYMQGGQQAFQNKVMESLQLLQEATGITILIPEERIEVYSVEGGTPFLDDEYTVFGQVITGISVIDSIATVKTDRYDRPLEDVHMTISVKKMKRKKISKLYGYSYE